MISSSDDVDVGASLELGATVSPGLETQTLLSSIFPLSSVREVGTDKFMMAYCVNLERLAIQAHSTARVITKEKSMMVNASTSQGGRDDVTGGTDSILGGIGGATEEEYVVEAFLENIDKIEALIRTLLALELWRENVLFRRGNHCERRNRNSENGTEEVVNETDRIDRNEHEDNGYLDAVDGGDIGNENDIVNTSISSKKTFGLACRLATNGNTLRSAFILHVETTIVSLLSLIFYRGVPPELLSSKDEKVEGKCDSIGGDDALLSLIDYCARQLAFLGTPEEHNPSISRQKNPVLASELSNHLENRTRLEEIQESMYETMYRTAVASVSLSRFICENSNELGPSLLSRLLEVHDFPLLMIPLIEEPPWTRCKLTTSRKAKNNSSGSVNESSKNTHSGKKIWEKLDDNNEWKEVPPTDLLRLTKLEGQPWLAIFHLTTSKVCRESYGLDEYRKALLMRLRKYIHETLIDQLPVLADVARYLDELCILGVPPSGQGGGAYESSSGKASWSGMLLQRVDLIRESIMVKKSIIGRNDDDCWERIAQIQWDEVFSHVTDSTDASLRRIASEVYGEVGDPCNASGIDITSALDTEKEKIQSIKEDCDLVDKVVLQMMEESGEVTFELAPVQENGVIATPTVTATPMGTFQRIKLSISQTDGECETVFPHAKIVATVHFRNSTQSDRTRKVMLSIDSLALPTVKHDVSQDDYDEVGVELPSQTFTSKEWRQLGNIETEDAVIQLGFKRLERGMVPAGSSLLRGYTLSQAFVSIRSPST